MPLKKCLGTAPKVEAVYQHACAPRLKVNQELQEKVRDLLAEGCSVLSQSNYWISA